VHLVQAGRVTTGGWWDRLTTPASDPPGLVVAAAAVLALLLVAGPRTWPLVRHAVTLVHEGGHALAALLVGRRLHGVRLHGDSSGLTTSSGRRRGPGAALTLAAGYPAPALLGLACAAVLARGYVLVVLVGLLAALVLLLLQVRNLFGLWSVLVVGSLLVGATWYLPDAWQQGAAHALTWFLLLASARPVVELHAARRGARGSDAAQLGALTRLPATVWTGVFLVVCCGAALLGGWLLVRPWVG
jgi:hypothetical protein